MTRQEAAALLGLDAGAAPDDVRRAFQRLARDAHPDRHPHDRDGATARFQRLAEARDLLLAPPAAPPPPPPVIVELRVSGPAAWRGGDVPVDLPDGRRGQVAVPSAVNENTILPVIVDGPGAWAVVVELDTHPWRRGPDATLGPLDLGGRLEVCLADVIEGAKITVPTPWSRGVELTLPPPRPWIGAPLRLKGHGLRPESGPHGSLVLELRVLSVDGSDALVRTALRQYRKPPRLI